MGRASRFFREMAGLQSLARCIFPWSVNEQIVRTVEGLKKGKN